MAGINTDNFRLVRVGVIGATGLVGECLLPLLAEDGYDVVAFSRSALTVKQQPTKQNITWRLLQEKELPKLDKIEKWIFLAPVWV